MEQNANNGELEKELKQKLKWYTQHAAEEEFDEKAVESILYLLEHVDPTEEDTAQEPEAAWERFRVIVENGQELLPLDEDKLPENPYAPRKKKSKFKGFILRHKVSAAAVLLLLVLAVNGTVRVGADMIRNNGVFFWMKEDETGVQMIVSPENLDDGTGVKRQVYYNKDDLPEWAKEWSQIENTLEMPEDYRWKYFEVNQLENRRQMVGHYLDANEKKNEILVGVWIYLDEAYSSEDFAQYSYVESYEASGKQIKVYDRIEETGEVFYMICFYDGSCQYFIQGQDDLDLLKELGEQYCECVK